MKIDDFVLENWLNPACDSEKNRIYLGGSCVSPITVKDLFELTGESMESFIKENPVSPVNSDIITDMKMRLSVIVARKDV